MSKRYVIDLPDDSAALAVAQTLKDSRWFYDHKAGCQLEAQARPKPAEPTGVGAVVECDPGPVYDRAWAVRVWAGDEFGGKAWDWYDSSGNGGRRHYDEMPVLRVLSEGVR